MCSRQNLRKILNVDRMRTQVHPSMSRIPLCKQQHAVFPLSTFKYASASKLTELTQMAEALIVYKGVPVLIAHNSCYSQR